MIVIAWIPVLVLVVGLIMYFACEGKLGQVGGWMFLAGLIVVLFGGANKSVRVGERDIKPAISRTS